MASARKGGPIGIGTLLAVALQGPIMQLVFHITHFEPRDVEHESLIETFRKLFPVHVPDPAAAEDVTRNS